MNNCFLLYPCDVGGTPLVPDKSIGLDSKKFGAVASPVPLNTSSTAAIGSSSSITSGSNGPQGQIMKVRQEALVLQRIKELQMEGMWTEKRLPKLQEPQRPKAHWDYLLEEMVWLAADFAQERKWKKAAAKKCARMVQKYFQDRALAAQRAELAQKAQLRRIAGFIAKEIKFFWENVEKLVEYKQQAKIEEKRIRAREQHLNFFVDHTEKITQQLAVGMNKQLADTSAAVSLNSSRRSSPKPMQSDDDEYILNEPSDDDEETIAKEEAEGGSDTNDEIAALQKESEMDLDDMDFLSDYLRNRDNILLSDEDDQKERKSEGTKDSEDSNVSH